MFVTTQGEYALRCMMTLAARPDARPVTLKELARLESISKDYVGKILNRLKHAGLVEPILGARGGYRLSRDASRITVKDVYLACERDGFKVFCLDESFRENSCRRMGSCGLRGVWRRVYSAAYSVMEGMTLESLVQEAAAERIPA